ncbi:MAG: 4Fe-4S binding protein [Clostridiales bacterium]|nr:4Fe-4S binding protein [Clostridiales bacterium]
MKRFDTKVQYLKFRVLSEVTRLAYEDRLLEGITDIPKTIIPGKVPTMRCCVYKERAILTERTKLAMGGDKKNPNIIEVIDIACDECPVGGFEVTESCRGCIAHRCEEACPKGAIVFTHEQKAHIDKDKCIECGRCAKVCPYTAIHRNKRPCENACKVKAISMSEDKTAEIISGKCVQCGACVYQCPFGAIMDKSFILESIDILKKSCGNTEYKVYAIVAPSISSQFTYAKLGQVVTGIKKLGFYSVVEAALGADMVADAESRELYEKGLLTSSCCPAFVKYIEQEFSDLTEHISHNLSPMAALGKYIKSRDEKAKVVFIGPCTAKKAEMRRDEVRPYIDSVLTFEELQALFDGRDIDITQCEEDVLDNASYFGRIFARSGGLSDAVRQGLKENGIEDFEYKPVACDGLEDCRMALLRLRAKKLNGNFIEGMACTGGCISGAGCLTHGEKDKDQVDKYGQEALEKTIKDAISILM